MTSVSSFESGHADMVHDAQLDYYGRRLATCSSDRTVKVFDIVGDRHTHLADLRGHEGPVWQVCWGHPKFGSILASCSFDHRVIIWKEGQGNQWQQAYISPGNLHTASVNSICWAPYELGLILACASSDGSVSFLEYKADGTWEINKLPGGHNVGCTAVSWAPATAPGSLVSMKHGQPGAVKRLATSGCDNLLKIWRYGEMGWEEEEALVGHSDWVRDVAWAPSLGLPKSTIASAGQDGQVFVWSERPAGGGWDRKLVHDFKVPVWRVSWSTTGSILAVSDGNNAVTLWKESMDGIWQQVTQ
ncbi:hypothetical protein VOLCADRAFT_80440 [Volvox carteri f. nagariensis]|uniref:Uncharacterized protein n=1 Tax=Volvox carteri f. nagariensis TaxID=3068 RepID=D8TRB3_VOLCA|nr:uncharacterized protein VOLCADRAFT_80440 [Volvox carteri f. nagariensis]EFJ49966.1 hypothetical protein VOLCADRAFT_80440 [Volvox carteri f. nagariensis]|eukprot:XP_002949031.1 hypothetical protein VOLCADRAFT_80440 [Volvox carteri f. nagariensis]